MLLHHLTWADVQARLEAATGPAGILVPIGSTEQHGPNGLIGTDAITAEAIACAAAERIDALVAPTIAVGMAEHHMGFAGTLTLRPSTLIAVVRDYVTSLMHHGFVRVMFVNGHGGNIATLGAAFAEIYGDLRRSHGIGAPDVRCRLLNWWDAEGVSALSKGLYGNADGSHATASEVAVTQHVLPQTIRKLPMSPEIAPTGGFADWRDYRRRFPDGRIGSNPALATPEAGGRLLEMAAAGTAKAFTAFLAEP